jgi:hypothetical protein
VKRISIVSVLAVMTATALVTGVALASTATMKKVVPFVATFNGNATTQAADSVVTINANGTGKATLLGAGKVTGAGKGDSSQRPCVPFTGTGKITGPGGTLIFKVNPSSVGCGDDSGQLFSISGKAAVLKATGKLKNAKGTLKMSGTYDRSSGAFTVKFKGSLTA